MPTVYIAHAKGILAMFMSVVRDWPLGNLLHEKLTIKQVWLQYMYETRHII